MINYKSFHFLMYHYWSLKYLLNNELYIFDGQLKAKHHLIKSSKLTKRLYMVLISVNPDLITIFLPILN